MLIIPRTPSPNPPSPLPSRLNPNVKVSSSQKDGKVKVHKSHLPQNLDKPRILMQRPSSRRGSNVNLMKDHSLVVERRDVIVLPWSTWQEMVTNPGPAPWSSKALKLRTGRKELIWHEPYLRGVWRIFMDRRKIIEILSYGIDRAPLSWFRDELGRWELGK